MASWGYCFSVIAPSREPAACPGEVLFGVPGGSGTEFEVGRTASEDEVFGSTTGAPMEIQSSVF